MKGFSLNSFPVNDKKVLVRVDYNVPLKDGKVKDDTKIKASLKTIRFLLKKGCAVVLVSHLGRPKGKVEKELSLKVVHKELKRLLKGVRVRFAEDSVGLKVKKAADKLKFGEVLLLENLRFHVQEEENDVLFAHSLANLAEVFVNDAFGVCHRKHASVDAVTRFLPSVRGFQVEKEVMALRRIQERCFQIILPSLKSLERAVFTLFLL